MTARMNPGTVEPIGVAASSPRDSMTMPKDCWCRGRCQPANGDVLCRCLSYDFLQNPGARRAAFRVGGDAPSWPLSVWPFLYEAAIDVNVFARHPPCREPFLEALPNGAPRELR